MKTLWKEAGKTGRRFTGKEIYQLRALPGRQQVDFPVKQEDGKLAHHLTMKTSCE
uniref:Uncharacterized protein n=1 Tax=Thermosporothrix sp. COM3 TaxID=2490863 RepID=A0A455SD43_9CHLR|nr:hypothetical protein KTC_00190 [Thermosporothrix sp. COM3]